MSSTALDFLSIPDNRNDTSNDTINPYAYPYFHSDGTSPLLYDLIVQFGGQWVALDPEHHEHAGSLAQLVRQIELRSETVPKEVSWKDSCGDTSLHRFCQVARLPASPLLWPNSKLLVQVVRALIRADPNLTTAVNNWQETPLLQFVTHCGFPLEQLPNSVDDDSSSIALMEMGANPILELVELLLWGGAASIESYPHMNLPIHCACNAGLEPTRPTPNQQAEGRQPRRLSLQSSNEDCDDQQREVQKWLEKQHFNIVKRLIRSFPSGVGFCDAKRRPPLLNAIISNACLDITELVLYKGGWQQHYTSILLDELFSQYNENRLAGRIQELLNFDAEPFIYDEYLKKLWKKTDAVLGVITDERRMVHATIKANAPVVVLQLAARMYPDQLSGRDNDSITPLMRTLTLRNPPPASVRFECLQVLLQANHRLAEIPNAAGQLPLHVACSQPDLLDWKKGLKLMFWSHPTAVSRRDPVSLLLPFQLAAAASSNADTAMTTSLDCTYELLRSDPSVLLLFS